MVRMLDILAEYLKYRQFPFQVRNLLVIAAKKLWSWILKTSFLYYEGVRALEQVVQRLWNFVSCGGRGATWTWPWAACFSCPCLSRGFRQVEPQQPLSSLLVIVWPLPLRFKKKWRKICSFSRRRLALWWMLFWSKTDELKIMWAVYLLFFPFTLTVLAADNSSCSDFGYSIKIIF